MLIEVLVSALVLVIASAGVITLLQTTTRSQAEQRHSSEAYSLAQEDQARLTSMRVEELWKLKEEREITLNQTKFTVHSTGVAINDVTSAPSCGEGSFTVDYLQITSIVTWPGMAQNEKAKIVSKIAPSKGSVDPVRGSLAVSVTNQQQVGMPGVEILGSGINGKTDATGCAIFPDLLEGNYSLTISGAAAGLVNKNGESSEVKQAAVVGGDTRRAVFEFDRPGTIGVKFKFWDDTDKKFKEPSTADSIVINHSGLKNAKIFGTPGGTRLETVKALPLFPFTSDYTIYAGSCATNDPDPNAKGENAAARPHIAAPAGGEATVMLQLPALDPIVWAGRNEANKGLPFPNADVWIRDPNCTKSGQPVTRRSVTNTLGRLSDMGIPWGTYNLCVDTEPGTKTSGVRRQRIEGVPVQSLTTNTKREFFLGSGTGAKSSEGSCP